MPSSRLTLHTEDRDEAKQRPGLGVNNERATCLRPRAMRDGYLATPVRIEGAAT